MLLTHTSKYQNASDKIARTPWYGSALMKNVAITLAIMAVVVVVGAVVLWADIWYPVPGDMR